MTDHLAELRKIVAPMRTTSVALDSGDPETVLIRAYALGALAAALDMASGVEREARAGSSMNALKIARHLYEQRIDLAYLLKHPDAALRQFRAREADNRLTISRDDPRRRDDPELWRKLEELRNQAKRRDTVASKERKARDVTEHGLVRFSEKAAGAGIKEEHDAVYGAASWLAHPGLTSAEIYLEESEESLSVRPGGPPAELLETPLTLSLVALFSIAVDISRVLGPFPEIDAALEHFKNVDIALRPESR